MPENFDFWKLLAGLGIFMYGMRIMEESIRKISGKAFKKLIRRYTAGNIKSIFSGLFTTSILQSSSAVSLMLLAFVGAGIMTMESAIGVILGSNIGTTLTGWIVAAFGFKIKIESITLPLIGIGGIGLIFLSKSEKLTGLSLLFIGFGLLFMGLDFMKSSVEGLTSSIDISAIPDYGIIVYLILGFLITAVMQASAATLAIVLTSLNAGIITFDSAAAMVIGANLGTTVTVLLGAVGGGQVKKRVAFSHFAFNFITGIIAAALMPLLLYLIQDIFRMSSEPLLGLALFHTIFNLLGVIVFFPFIRIFSKGLVKLFPEKSVSLSTFINRTSPEVPEAGIHALKNEVLHFLKNVLAHNLTVLGIEEKLVFSDYNYTSVNGRKVRLPQEEQYKNLKMLQGEIIVFAAGMQSKELDNIEAEIIGSYLHAVRMGMHSAKSLKDIKHNLDEFEDSDNLFLSEQFSHFRKRIIETYLSIEKLMNNQTSEDLPETFMQLLKMINGSDKNFISGASKAIQAKTLENLEASSSIMVNRAFVQSAKQAALALSEILLTKEEQAVFEELYESYFALSH